MCVVALHTLKVCKTYWTCDGGFNPSVSMQVLHLSTMTADFAPLSFHRLEATFKTKESAFCFKLNSLDFCLSDQFLLVQLECLYDNQGCTCPHESRPLVRECADSPLLTVVPGL